MLCFSEQWCVQVEEEAKVWRFEDFPPEPPKGSRVSLATYQRFKSTYLHTEVEECYLTPEELDKLQAGSCGLWKQYLLRVNLRNFE